MSDIGLENYAYRSGALHGALIGTREDIEEALSALRRSRAAGARTAAAMLALRVEQIDRLVTEIEAVDDRRRKERDEVYDRLGLDRRRHLADRAAP